MAARAAFNAALVRCGFTVAAAGEFVAFTGYSTAEEVVELPKRDITETFKQLVRTHPNTPFPIRGQVRFRALHRYLTRRHRLNLPLAIEAFVNPVIDQQVAAMEQDERRKELDDNDTVAKPEPLKNLKEWYKWYNSLQTYLVQIRGAAETPFVYLIRDHTEVTPEMLVADYETEDAQSIALTPLVGPDYDRDNHKLYDELKVLMQAGEAWPFIQPYDRTRNGRAAVISLRRQCEGDAFHKARKEVAYRTIATTKYTGDKRGYTFTAFVSRFQTAFNDLEYLGETVPETRKVHDFLAAIEVDGDLNTVKVQCAVGSEYQSDFHKVQQVMLDAYNHFKAQESPSRNVSAAGRGGQSSPGRTSGSGQSGKSSPGKRKKGDKDKDKDDVHRIRGGSDGGFVKHNEWIKLTAQQRKEIIAARAASGDKKVSAVETNTNKSVTKSNSQAEDETSATNNAGGNAGQKFGSKSYKKNKPTVDEE